MQVSFSYAFFAAMGVILSAVYMLWMVQRTFYGETPDHVRKHVTDMNAREWVIMIPLVVLMVWMGIGTKSFLPPVTANNEKTLEMVLRPAGALNAAAARPAEETAHAR
jgi:NADH-quinone oxidoreductase subunit M